MKISFGAKILTKPEQFFLPTDTEEEKIHIRKNFKELEDIFEIPPVKKFTQNDTLTLTRKKSKKGFKYAINYKPQNSTPQVINFHLFSLNDFSAANAFEQITYFLAYINNKLPNSLFGCSDYKYILESLYLNMHNN